MKYTDISRAHRELKKLESGRSAAADCLYWTAHQTFRVQLQDALRDNELLHKLTKPQFLRVLSWCTAFRPYEAHVILTMFSKLAN